MKKFSVIWAGQFVSILGSGISSFGLSVWLFMQTGVATPFALSFLFSILPTIVFAPLAGSFADRRYSGCFAENTDDCSSFCGFDEGMGGLFR